MLHSAIPQFVGNLRTHQINAKDEILRSWDEVNSVMLQMPTGTGKTFLFTSIIKDLINYYKQARKRLNILVVAHRTELLDQISSSLDRYGIPHGFIQGNREQHLWQRVQVGSILSLLTSKNELNVLRLDFNYIIIDEAHHSLAETYKKLFTAFPNAKKLGVTATPWRLNHEPFISLYDKLITTPQVSWFIEQGLLADFDYVSIKPDSDIQRMINNTEIAQTGDFVNVELDVAFNNQRIRSKVFTSYKQFADGRKGIIYAINKEHAAKLASLYCSKGIKAVAIDCDTPKEERKALIEAFKEGRISVLVNVEIFTEGFDCPDVSFIQLARPTRSLALYLQQVGRGLRIVEGKEKTIIIDNVGLYNYFGLPDANRKWQHHFRGNDDFKEIQRDNYEKGEDDIELVENNYNEDDEEMMIVRGSKKDIQTNSYNEKSNTVVLPILEFSVCDYYLVMGNVEKFRIYPFVKKRGKVTEALCACQFEYDKTVNEIVLSNDDKNNLKMIAMNYKLQTIISFLAALIKIPLKQLLSFNEIKKYIKVNDKQEFTLFDLLKYIDAVYQDYKFKS